MNNLAGGELLLNSGNHKLTLKHLGPISECSFTVSRFNVLTGPQSNGKSTVAKAIYFFRTVKNDILNIMMQGGPQAVTGKRSGRWQTLLQQHLKDKFLQLFGTSWIMPHDMRMEYDYQYGMWIHVFLQADHNDFSRNYVNVEFSQGLNDYLSDLDRRIFSDMTPGQKLHEEENLSQIFNDDLETVFIPAGRNLITLLSAQLNYIFTSLEGSQLRNIDYITKRYTELILKLKPMFAEGMDGIIQEHQERRSEINLLIAAAEKVLQGSYRYVDGEERLYLPDRKYVKINLASSGQQEVVWVFNLLFYYLIENKKVFLIVEEPESHLYPDSQEIMGQVLALMLNCGSSVLTTTHSPYILGTFNYLLAAGQVQKKHIEEVKTKVHKRFWISPSDTNAQHIHDGIMEPAVDHEDSITLIKNELIDGASHSINEKCDLCLGFLYEDSEEL